MSKTILRLCYCWSQRITQLRQFCLRIYQVQAHRRRPSATETKEARSGVREIDHAALRHRTAVVHTHHNRFVVAQVCDANQRAKRKAAMGARKLIHVKVFPAGGLLPLEFFAIPGGAAYLIPVTLLVCVDLGISVLPEVLVRKRRRLW